MWQTANRVDAERRRDVSTHVDNFNHKLTPHIHYENIYYFINNGGKYYNIDSSNVCGGIMSGRVRIDVFYDPSTRLTR